MKKWLSLPVALLMVGCATITKFDQNSYNAAQQLRAQSVAVMASPSGANVDGLRARLDAQVAYESGKGKANTLSTTQWKLIARKDGYLLGGWITDYQAGKPMSAPYVAEKTRQVEAAFDEILKLEGGKLR